jgi:hypothetical protein
MKVAETSCRDIANIFEYLAQEIAEMQQYYLCHLLSLLLDIYLMLVTPL